MNREDFLERLQYVLGAVVILPMIFLLFSTLSPLIQLTFSLQVILTTLIILLLVVIDIVYFQRIELVEDLHDDAIYRHWLLLLSICVQLVLLVLIYRTGLLEPIARTFGRLEGGITWFLFPSTAAVTVIGLNIFLPSQYRITQLEKMQMRQRSTSYQEFREDLRKKIEDFLAASKRPQIAQASLTDSSTTEQILATLADRFNEIGNVLHFLMLERYLDTVDEDMHLSQTVLKEWTIKGLAGAAVVYEVILGILEIIKSFLDITGA